MKKITTIVVSVASTLLTFVSAATSFAQYGACAPACDVPQVEACAPTCAPTCAPACEPNCYPGCDPCYNGCGVFSILDGAARAVVAPFHWLACAFTEGTYPDCGCAPRPPKTKCDPCTICGDYQGGCNDQCKYGNSCAPCGGYPQQIQYQGNFSGALGQNVEYYDSESYDSSPTRMKLSSSNFQPRPTQQAARPNALAQLIAPIVAPNSVRPVSYEQSNMPAQAPQVVRNVTTPMPVQVVSQQNQWQALQNKDNVRIVAAAPEQSVGTVGKTFGSTRAVNSATQLR